MEPYPPIDRARAFAGAAVIAGVNGFAGPIAKVAHRASPMETVLALGGVSAIVWAAFIALLVIGRVDGVRTPLSMPDRAILAAMAVASLTPINLAGSCALLLAGIYLMATSHARSRQRRVAAVMLALTGPLIWGRVLLALLGPVLLGWDARLAALLAGVPVRGNVVHFFHQPGVLYVALGCSSVHNMSLAVLLFVILIQLLDVRMTPRLVGVCALAAASMAVVNIVRLAAMARFPDHFDYLHTGEGGQLFGLASFLVAGLLCGLGVAAAARRT